jgi:tyrosyl-tRNA synthetase
MRAYDGFEPSGRMHIAQGILRAINVNKLVDAGCVFVFWVADWFAMLNNKFDGDLEKIRIVGKYFIEVWRAVGMKMENVQFLWASDEINRRPDEYWLTVMDVARKNTISRVKRCATALGKKEGDDLSVAQLFYPCMQCTDIFFLALDICQLGLDQKKVNMLAREYCKTEDKPIIVSHGMMLGLMEGQAKMSKSDPNSAIFMEDTEEDVRKKIRAAFCREKELDNNPVIDYCRQIIFQARDRLVVLRKPENGGDKTYLSFEELAKDYQEGLLHPGDLKQAVAACLNEMIQPVRDHF